MKTFYVAIVLSLIACSFAFAQTASIPPYINYQGRLTQSDGSGITGLKTIELNVYDESGNKVWGPQIFQNVSVVDGHFNVILGTDGNGKPVTESFDGNSRYLGIKVDGGSEIAPRQQILSTAYAVQSEYTQVAKSVTNSAIPFMKGYINGCTLEYIDVERVTLTKGVVEIDGSFYGINTELTCVLPAARLQGLYAVYVDTTNITDYSVTAANISVLHTLKPDNLASMPVWDDDRLGWYLPANPKARCVGFFYNKEQGINVAHFTYRDGFYSFLEPVSYRFTSAGTVDITLACVPHGASRGFLQFRAKSSNYSNSTLTLRSAIQSATSSSRLLAYFLFKREAWSDYDIAIGTIIGEWFQKTNIIQEFNIEGNFSSYNQHDNIGDMYFDVYGFWWSPDAK